MKLHLEQIKFHRKESGFVDSGFVKTCDELVIGLLPTDFKTTRGKKKEKVIDDKSVKDAIMHKYGYVDQAVDARYHRPTLKREVTKHNGRP